MDSSKNPTADASATASIPDGIPVRDDRVPAPADTALTRRTALKMFSATALLATTAGCTRKPERHIVSMVERPEYMRPGVPLYYASTWTEGAWPYGMRVKSVDGRPIKIEGLPGHPLNGGATTAQMQASTLSLYDPNRLRAPALRGKADDKLDAAAAWKQADQQILAALRAAKSVVLLTRANLGPSERALVARFKQAAPLAKHFAYESAHDGDRRAAWSALYGADGVVMPDLAKARVILSLGSDFLGADGDVLAATRGFADGRQIEGDPKEQSLSRLYVAEAAMSMTGSNADHRLPLRPALLPAFAAAVATAVAGDKAPLHAFAKSHGLEAKLLDGLVLDLLANRGAAAVLAGPNQPAAVHAAAAQMNAALDAGGKTLQWNPTPPTLPVASTQDIRAALDAGPDVLLMLGVNPGYDWAGGGFDALQAKASLSVGHGLTMNETLAACTIALPSTHNLESWNDAAPVPGVLGLCQPLIAPLFDGRQEAESLLTWTVGLEGGKAANWHDYLEQRWLTGTLAGQGATGWEAALRAGLVGTPKAVPFPTVSAGKAAGMLAGVQAGPTAGFDLLVQPHHVIGDGRDGGNAWLLELPDPVSKLVWENAAVMGPKTASGLGVSEGDWITVKGAGAAVDIPVLVQPGTAAGAVICTLGHGRLEGAGPGNDSGFNCAPLVGSGAGAFVALGASVSKKSGAGRHKFVRTQKTFSQHDRPLARSGTLGEYIEHPDFAVHRSHTPELVQIDEEWDYSKGHKWGLAIDLGRCTGCSACTIACQSENNVPIVGKDEVSRGRDMSWIRLDRYEAGDPENPEVSQQPMLCQHCDNAPCENVCPVNATTHSPEGLNDQVYNRCVGTRYCANNCPYKVRRFNFFNYPRETVKDPVQEMVFNPQVTVRMRGIMEKCTFCVQRINAGRFVEKNSGTPLKDGDIKPACEQACPASAIVFGDANDPESRVAKARKSNLAYHVLDELNVRPNITYLAKVRNPNPSVAATHAKGDH